MTLVLYELLLITFKLGQGHIEGEIGADGFLACARLQMNQMRRRRRNGWLGRGSTFQCKLSARQLKQQDSEHRDSRHYTTTPPRGRSGGDTLPNNSLPLIEALYITDLAD